MLAERFIFLQTLGTMTILNCCTTVILRPMAQDSTKMRPIRQPVMGFHDFQMDDSCVEVRKVNQLKVEYESGKRMGRTSLAADREAETKEAKYASKVAKAAGASSAVAVSETNTDKTKIKVGKIEVDESAKLLEKTKVVYNAATKAHDNSSDAFNKEAGVNPANKKEATEKENKAKATFKQLADENAAQIKVAAAYQTDLSKATKEGRVTRVKKETKEEKEKREKKEKEAKEKAEKEKAEKEKGDKKTKDKDSGAFYTDVSDVQAEAIPGSKRGKGFAPTALIMTWIGPRQHPPAYSYRRFPYQELAMDIPKAQLKFE